VAPAAAVQQRAVFECRVPLALGPGQSSLFWAVLIRWRVGMLGFPEERPC
jgi:hypothetical protein